MSEEELEQDELDGADEDDGEELARPTTAKRTAATATRPCPREEGESRRGGRGAALGRSQAERA